MFTPHIPSVYDNEFIALTNLPATDPNIVAPTMIVEVSPTMDNPKPYNKLVVNPLWNRRNLFGGDPVSPAYQEEV